MATKIKVQVKLEGEVAKVKSLVVHPMETGARKDPDTDTLVPRHHIEQLTFANNGTPVLVANCSTAIARNPYFNFSFRGASPGDKFTVSWVDNRGETDSLETILS
jgi:sulfur-oxidizing protein SoxZ